jgi:hypothetical protein
MQQPDWLRQRSLFRLRLQKKKRGEGRATARTKRPAVTIVEEPPVVVKQELEMSALPGPPAPKRRRTTNGSVNGLPMGDNWFWSATPDTAVLPTELPQTRCIREYCYLQSYTCLSKSPQPVARKPRPRANPAPSAPPNTAPRQ